MDDKLDECITVLDEGNVSLRLGLHGVEARRVRHHGYAVQFGRKLGVRKVLLGDGVEMAEIAVHGVVLHHGEAGAGTKNEIGGGFTVVGFIHGGVGGRRESGGVGGRVGVDSVDSGDFLSAGTVRGNIAPREIVRDGGNGGFLHGIFAAGIVVFPGFLRVDGVILGYIGERDNLFQGSSEA